MEEELNIILEVAFPGERGFTAEAVAAAVESISRAIYEAEQEELEAIVDEFRELPLVVRDGMAYRMDRIDMGRAFNIEYGARGSLILIGVGAGLAYWIADKTLGETVKDAWVESSSHARLKEFLKARVFRKRERIVDAMNRRWLRGAGTEQLRATILRGERSTIRVEVLTDPDARIPAPSEIAAKRRETGKHDRNLEG